MMPATTIAFTKPRMRDTIVPEARKALARPMRSSAIARFLRCSRGRGIGGFAGGPGGGAVDGGSGFELDGGPGVGLDRGPGVGLDRDLDAVGGSFIDVGVRRGIGCARLGGCRGIRCPLAPPASDVAPDADAEDE